MRYLVVLWTLGLATQWGCGGGAPAPAPKEEAAARKPVVSDQGHLMPRTNQVSAQFVDTPLYGKAFLTGGNVARYRKGAKEYELFLVRADSPTAAAIMLLEYKKAMPDAKFIAHFSGYAGTDSEMKVFVFTKGSWLAGVRGLPQGEADMVARDYAARLN